MKNLIVMAVATMFATNAVAAEMKWNGGVGWRYENTSNNDSLDSKNNTTANKDVSTTKTKTHAMRANLGVTGGWEHVEYGFGVRTTGYNGGTAGANRNNSYAYLSQVGDLGIGVDTAWFRYVRDFGSLDFSVTAGRGGLIWNADGEWQTLFDNDLRTDGFNWHFQSGMFGFNAAQLVLGGTTRSGTGSTTGNSTISYTEASEDNAATGSRFAMLYAFNPYMNWKFSDDIDALFSVAYYKWIHEGAANRNQIGGGVNSTNNTAGTVAAAQNGALKMDNISQWDFLAHVTLPYSLALTADLVKANKAKYSAGTVTTYAATAADVEVSNTAWTLGLTYGKLRKAQDFSLGYAYSSKGVGSMIGAFTDEKFAPDNKGHIIKVGYAMADNFNLGFRTMMLQEKERLSATGAAATDGKEYAGTKANQKMKTNYWELTAGVQF